MADTYNPILSREELGRSLRPPVPEPGTALVLSGSGQPLLTITVGQRGLTIWEMIRGKYNLLYKVDMTEHLLSFCCNLPCATNGYDFHAEVKFRCSVLDPEMVVQRNLTDVRQVLEPLIVKVMRFNSCDYEISQRKAAEQEISLSLEKAVYDACFHLKYFALTLSLPEEFRKRYQYIETKRGEIKDALLIEAEAEQLEGQRYKSARRLVQNNIDFYSDILNQGNGRLLALHLAKRPDDIQFVLQVLNQEQQIQREHHIKMLKMLLDEDVIEKWQIGEVGQRAVNQLLGLTEQSIPVLSSSQTYNIESPKNVVIDPPKNISPPTSKPLPPKPAPPPRSAALPVKPASPQSSRVAAQPPPVPPQSTDERPKFNWDEDE